MTNPDAQSVTLNNAFTYALPAPTLTSVSPTSGTTAGGTAITLTGTQLRVGRDGARRRHGGDGRHLRQRDAAARDDAGGHGGRDEPCR